MYFTPAIRANCVAVGAFPYFCWYSSYAALRSDMLHSPKSLTSDIRTYKLFLFTQHSDSQYLI